MEEVALVTGSTNNIGKAIAEVLAGKGFHVIVTSRNEEEGEGGFRKAAEEGFLFWGGFSQVTSIEGLFAFIRDRFRRLDVLVNNVAYTKNESISDCDLNTWEHTINTNLRSYYLCTKLASETLKGTVGGAIVNIYRLHSRGSRDKFSYLVSKGGVNSLTMCGRNRPCPF